MFGKSSDPTTNMVVGATSYRSPKRKRDDLETETEEHSPPASPTSTLSVASYPEARLREEEELGRYSPRTAVAGRLKDLVIHESGLSQSLPITQWRSSLASTIDLTESPRQVEQSQSIPEESSSPVVQDSSNANTQDAKEQPSTDHSSQFMKNSTTVPSRNKGKATLLSRSRRKNSPPPSETIVSNPLTWSDSEITGHNPTDPNDDGYGINGIGFKPTAAIAWARSQKRQKQVAEWKNREAREAREKRRERREGMPQTKSQYDDASDAAQKKVKFDLG